jgi:hypothetical protein
MDQAAQTNVQTDPFMPPASENRQGVHYPNDPLRPDGAQPVALEPIREPVAPATPETALESRQAELDRREALIQARERRMDDILKNNALEAHKVDDSFVDSQIVGEYAVVGTDAFEGHQNITPEAARALSCLTICVYLLRNGAIVTGEAIADHPDVYDHTKGMELAREDAKRKIWRLETYVQRNKLMGL